jgi:hypothetical protein
MQNQAWTDALAVVLNGIADEPTRLNNLPHDILRKLIICVGTLDINQTVEINDKTYKLKRIIEALNRYDGNSTNCEQCGLLEIHTGPSNMINICYFGCNDMVCKDCSHACMCDKCTNVICNICWPKSSKGYCRPCDEYEDTECLYCIEKMEER